MNKWLILFLTAAPSLYGAQSLSNGDDTFVLDQIERVIITAADKPGKVAEDAASPRQVKIITSRQLALPDLAGRVVPPEQKLEEVTRIDLYSMYGNRFGIMQAEEEVDKYITMIAQSNKMKPDDLKRVFTSAGRTEEEGKAEIADGYRAKAVMQMKIGEGIVISRRKVEEYFAAHPELQESSYCIQYAHVPYSTVKNVVEQKSELSRYARTGFGALGVAWSEPFWVSRSEVAQEKSFIFDLKQNEIAPPYETAQGFELYRMKEIKLPTVEDRYNDIVEILQQPLMEARKKEFEERELFQKAAIIDVKRSA